MKGLRRKQQEKDANVDQIALATLAIVKKVHIPTKETMFLFAVINNKTITAIELIMMVMITS